ncbi:MAG: MurR/RpiR family transcriptional regulator, partial [Clostridiales bacterium]|nr:MurR/RpiR family transcriptional regulator [Clostridiales bacterium]
MQKSPDLVQRINEKYPSMSKGQKQISEFILNNYDKAAFMTALRLGDKVNVSESTVVRYAMLLGYGGYPELQRSLQEIVRNKLT